MFTNQDLFFERVSDAKGVNHCRRSTAEMHVVDWPTQYSRGQSPVGACATDP
jgi:hypothetical protein